MKKRFIFPALVIALILAMGLCAAAQAEDEHICWVDSSVMERVIEGKAPTCTEDGWMNLFRCPQCKRFTDDKNNHYGTADSFLDIFPGGAGKLPAGHDWSNKDGECALCHMICDHGNGEKYVYTNPEMDPAKHIRTCKTCGKSDMLDHEWDAETGKCAIAGCDYACEHPNGFNAENVCPVCGWANTDREEVEAYRDSVNFDDERHSDDSEAVKALFEEGEGAIAEYEYNPEWTLEGNCEAIDGIKEDYVQSVETQREAEVDAYKATVNMDEYRHEDDSDDVSALADKAESDIAAYHYIAEMFVEDNCEQIDGIQEEYRQAMEDQRETEVLAFRDELIEALEGLRSRWDDANTTASIDDMIAALQEEVYNSELYVTDQENDMAEWVGHLKAELYNYFAEQRISGLKKKGEPDVIRDTLDDTLTNVIEDGCGADYQQSLADLMKMVDVLEFNGINGKREISAFIRSLMAEMVKANKEVVFGQAEKVLTAEELEDFLKLEPVQQGNAFLTALGLAEPDADNELSRAIAERIAAMSEEDKAAWQAQVDETLRFEKQQNLSGYKCDIIRIDIGDNIYNFGNRTGKWTFEKWEKKPD